MELSQKVINLYSKLVYYFNRMLFDRKLIEKGKNQKKRIFFNARNAQKFLFTESQKLTYEHDLNVTIDHKIVLQRNISHGLMKNRGSS